MPFIATALWSYHIVCLLQRLYGHLGVSGGGYIYDLSESPYAPTFKHILPNISCQGGHLIPTIYWGIGYRFVGLQHLNHLIVVAVDAWHVG